MIDQSQSFSFPFVYCYAASITLALYAAYHEIFRKTINDNIALLFWGFGLSYHSFIGGLGGNFVDSSLLMSLAGSLCGGFFYLPFAKYFKKKFHFLFFWLAIGALLGPLHFLYVYFYTCLVCALLSIFIVYKKRSASSVEKKVEGKDDPEATIPRGMAPYYSSSILGILIVWFDLL